MTSSEDFQGNGGSSPGASTSRLPQATAPDASEDLLCPICLDTADNAAYVAFCMHRFCFGCIRQWSATRAECPLCQR
uniref:RING-type E3 ubiquitin transferase n=1 Tax=Apteryx owenii TaxID=8824 RepID=A0A8B9PGH8_APTOW